MVHAYLKQTEISLLHALIAVVILSKSTIEKLVHSVESRMVKVMVSFTSLYVNLIYVTCDFNN